MFRALLELIITIIIARAARAILGSLMKGFTTAAGQAQQARNPGAQKQTPREEVSFAGELHKDPVCGTYVSEATGFKRGSGKAASYYCSEACKEKHAVASRT